MAANVRDINYLKDVKLKYHDCVIIGDKGYLNSQVQLDLFKTANIRLAPLAYLPEERQALPDRSPEGAQAH